MVVVVVLVMVLVVVLAWMAVALLVGMVIGAAVRMRDGVGLPTLVAERGDVRLRLLG